MNVFHVSLEIREMKCKQSTAGNPGVSRVSGLVACTIGFHLYVLQLVDVQRAE